MGKDRVQEEDGDWKRKSSVPSWQRVWCASVKTQSAWRDERALEGQLPVNTVKGIVMGRV